MKIKDDLLLQEAYDQILISEGWKDWLAALTFTGMSVGMFSSLGNQKPIPEIKKQLSIHSHIAAENPIFLDGFKYVTGKDFWQMDKQNIDSSVPVMYVAQKIIQSVGGTGGEHAATILVAIKKKIEEKKQQGIDIFSLTVENDLEVLDNIAKEVIKSLSKKNNFSPITTNAVSLGNKNASDINLYRQIPK